MPYRIVVSPEARDQLDALHDYIADAASPEIAARLADGILDHLAVLADSPRIGTPRDDLRAGLLTHRRRVTIASVVEAAAVVVIGFFYGGQDFETLVRDERPRSLRRGRQITADFRGGRVAAPPACRSGNASHHQRIYM